MFVSKYRVNNTRILEKRIGALFEEFAKSNGLGSNLTLPEEGPTIMVKPQEETAVSYSLGLLDKNQLIEHFQNENKNKFYKKCNAEI